MLNASNNEYFFFTVRKRIRQGASTKYSFDQGSGFVLGDEVMMC